MLSDHERRTLRDVEDQLTAQDPAFARSFDATGPSTYTVRSLYELPLWVYRLVIGVAVTLGLLMLISGSPTALLFAALAVMFVCLQKRRSEPGREKR